MPGKSRFHNGVYGHKQQGFGYIPNHKQLIVCIILYIQKQELQPYLNAQRKTPNM